MSWCRPWKYAAFRSATPAVVTLIAPPIASASTSGVSALVTSSDFTISGGMLSSGLRPPPCRWPSTVTRTNRESSPRTERFVEPSAPRVTVTPAVFFKRSLALWALGFCSALPAMTSVSESVPVLSAKAFAASVDCSATTTFSRVITSFSVRAGGGGTGVWARASSAASTSKRPNERDRRRTIEAPTLVRGRLPGHDDRAQYGPRMCAATSRT